MGFVKMSIRIFYTLFFFILFSIVCESTPLVCGFYNLTLPVVRSAIPFDSNLYAFSGNVSSLRNLCCYDLKNQISMSELLSFVSSTKDSYGGVINNMYNGLLNLPYGCHIAQVDVNNSLYFGFPDFNSLGRFVRFSSSSVYGRPPVVPCTETCKSGFFVPACMGLGDSLFSENLMFSYNPGVSLSESRLSCTGKCKEQKYYRLSNIENNNGISCDLTPCTRTLINCNSLVIEEDTDLNLKPFWTPRYQIPFYANMCYNNDNSISGNEQGEAWICRTCPISFLPLFGEYSIKFYSDNGLLANKFYTFETITKSVTVSAGISSCQQWIQCNQGRQLLDRVCATCDGIKCKEGWFCNNDIIQCQPCSIPHNFVNPEKLVWALESTSTTPEGCAWGCSANYFLLDTSDKFGCIQCPANTYCPGVVNQTMFSAQQCPEGFVSMQGSAATITDCIPMQTSRPTIFTDNPSASLIWQTTECLSFEHEEELIMTVFANFFPLEPASEFPRLASVLCNGKFTPATNPEFLRYIPCVCKTEFSFFEYVDDGGGTSLQLSIHRVVPKTLTCPVGFRLMSPGKPVESQAVQDNYCIPCSQIRCGSGLFSPLCAEGYTYLDYKFYDKTFQLETNITRYSLKRKAQPTQCSWECDKELLAQFEYFGNTSIVGQCRLDVCNQCPFQSPVPYSRAYGYIEAFYATECHSQFEGGLQCFSCWNTLSGANIARNQEAIIFEHGVTFITKNTDLQNFIDSGSVTINRECAWTCKVGFKKLWISGEINAYQCVRCNSTKCSDGFTSTGCKFFNGDSLEPVCEPCAFPDTFAYGIGGPGLSWQWTNEGECTFSCVPGFFLDKTGNCVACPEGYSCTGELDSIPQRCPEGTWSISIGQHTCHPCPENHFCSNATMKTPCPVYHTSFDGSMKIDDCVCMEGFWQASVQSCMVCPANYYCIAGEKIACPENTNSFMGSISLADCKNITQTFCKLNEYTSGCVCRKNQFMELITSLPQTKILSTVTQTKDLFTTASVLAGYTESTYLFSETGYNIKIFNSSSTLSYVIAGRNYGKQDASFSTNLDSIDLFSNIVSLTVSQQASRVWVADYERGLIEVILEKVGVPYGRTIVHSSTSGFVSMSLLYSGRMLLLSTSNCAFYSFETISMHMKNFFRDNVDGVCKGSFVTYDETFIVSFFERGAKSFARYIFLENMQIWEEQLIDGSNVPSSNIFSVSVNVLPYTGKQTLVAFQDFIYELSIVFLWPKWTMTYKKISKLFEPGSLQFVDVSVVEKSIESAYLIAKSPGDVFEVFLLTGGYLKNTTGSTQSIEGIVLKTKQCLLCQSGYTSLLGSETDSVCVYGGCPENYWCAEGKQYPCPLGTVSPPGQSDQSSCVCVDGTSQTYVIATNFNATNIVDIGFKRLGLWDYYAVDNEFNLGKPNGIRCTDGFRPGGCFRVGVYGIQWNNDNFFLGVKNKLFLMTPQGQESLLTELPPRHVFVNVQLQEQFETDPILVCIVLHQKKIKLYKFNIDGQKVFESTLQGVSQWATDSFIWSKYIVLLRGEGQTDNSVLHVIDLDSLVTTKSVMMDHSNTTTVFRLSRAVQMESTQLDSVSNEVLLVVSYGWLYDSFEISTIWSDLTVEKKDTLSIVDESIVTMQFVYNASQTFASHLVICTTSNTFYFYMIDHSLAGAPGTFTLLRQLEFDKSATIEFFWITIPTFNVRVILSDDQDALIANPTQLVYVQKKWDNTIDCNSTNPQFSSLFSCSNLICSTCQDYGYLGDCFTCPNGTTTTNTNLPSVSETEGHVRLSSHITDCITDNNRYWDFETETVPIPAPIFLLDVSTCRQHPFLKRGDSCVIDSIAATIRVENYVYQIIHILNNGTLTKIAGGSDVNLAYDLFAQISIPDIGDKYIIDTIALGNIRGFFWSSGGELVIVDSTQTHTFVRKGQVNGLLDTLEVLTVDKYVLVSAVAFDTRQPYVYMHNSIGNTILVCNFVRRGLCVNRFTVNEKIYSLTASPFYNSENKLIACTASGIIEITKFGAKLLFATAKNCTLSSSPSDSWLVVSDQNKLFVYDLRTNTIIRILGSASIQYNNVDGLSKSMVYTWPITSLSVSIDSKNIFFVSGPSVRGGSGMLGQPQLRKSTTLTLPCTYARANVSDNNESRFCDCPLGSCVSEDGECTLAGQDYYADGINCYACPPGSFTLGVGSTTFYACQCNKGHILSNQRCQPCPLNTFKQDAQPFCISCPLHSVTFQEATSEIWDCICLPGFISIANNVSGFDCVQCTNSTFYPSDVQYNQHIDMESKRLCYDCPFQTDPIIPDEEIRSSIWDCFIPPTKHYVLEQVSALFSDNATKITNQSVLLINTRQLLLENIQPVLSVDEKHNILWFVVTGVDGYEYIYYSKLFGSSAPTFRTAVLYTGVRFNQVKQILLGNSPNFFLYIVHVNAKQQSITRLLNPFSTTYPQLSNIMNEKDLIIDITFDDEIRNAFGFVNLRKTVKQPLSVTKMDDIACVSSVNTILGDFLYFFSNAQDPIEIARVSNITSFFYDVFSDILFFTHDGNKLSRISGLTNTENARNIQQVDIIPPESTLRNNLPFISTAVLVTSNSMSIYREGLFQSGNLKRIEFEKTVVTAVPFNGGNLYAVKSTDNVLLLQLTVKDCPPSNFCQNGFILKCGLFEISVANESYFYCQCKPGYFRNNSNQCDLCPFDRWCLNETIFQCPNGTFSERGSLSKTDCVCASGQYQLLNNITNEVLCLQCPTGSTTNNFDNVGIGACFCIEGYYLETTDICKPAPKGTYTFRNSTVNGISPCPDNHTTFGIASKSPADCVCDNGYYKSGEICQSCPAFIDFGFDSAFSEIGSLSVQDCICPPGSYLSQSLCKPCPLGSYCVGDNNISSCPPFSETFVVPAKSIFECFCSKGYEGSVETGCLDVGNCCTECISNSVSVPQLLNDTGIATSKCVCQDGFYFSNNSVCVQCLENHYCFVSDGKSNMVACSPNAVSMPGSSKENDCKCKSNYYTLNPGLYNDNCLPCMEFGYVPSETPDSPCICENGFFVGDLVDDYTFTCFSCPPQFFCQNGERTSCPFNSVSGPLSVSEYDCVCLDGFIDTRKISGATEFTYNENVTCDECPQLFYCPSPTEVYACPFETAVKSIELPSRVSLYDCEPKLGYVRELDPFINNTWKKCEAGKFCPNADFTIECGIGATSMQGSFSEKQCVCEAGYFKLSDIENLNLTFINNIIQYSLDYYDDINYLYNFYNYNNLLEDKCLLCPKGFFCLGMHPPLQCPANTTSVYGSKSADSCGCQCWEGQLSHFIQDGQCMECPLGKYCVNGTSFDCPINTYCNHDSCLPQACSIGRYTEVTGNDNINDCQCLTGHYALNVTAPCSPCEINTFCILSDREVCQTNQWAPSQSTTCYDCPANTERQSVLLNNVFNESGNITDCFPVEGFFGHPGLPATQCPENFFCVVGTPVAIACPTNSISQKQSGSITECYCQNGYYFSNGTCAICEADHVCLPGNSRLSCPNNTSTKTLTGQYLLTACLPDEGFYTVGNTIEDFTVITCNLNSYCDGSKKEPTACPPGFKTENTGSINISFCICNAGQYRFSDFECKDCPLDTFCPERSVLPTPCPPNSSTVQINSIKISDCICDEGFFAETPFTENNSTGCEVCDEGFYCPRGNFRLQCFENSISNAGSVSYKDCYALPGYYWLTNDTVAECTNDFYCPGNITQVFSAEPFSGRIACPTNSITISPKATKIEDCKCAAGLYADYEIYNVMEPNVLCIECPLDSYCPFASNAPISCGINQRSPVQSIFPSQCVCPPGFTTMGVYDLLQCLQCPANFYCEAGTHKQPCDPYGYAISQPGSQVFEECFAIPGYYKKALHNFIACEIGYYCDGVSNKRVRCPEHYTTSGFRTVNRSDCVCNSQLCVNDTAVPDIEATTNVECANNTFESDGVCISNAGYYAQGMICTKDYYCPLDNYDTQFKCPELTNTLAEGSITVNDCVCELGYANNRERYNACNDDCVEGYTVYDVNAIVCVLCLENHYCPYNTSEAVQCPVNSISPKGSFSIINCSCLPGYYENNGTCATCPINSFCTGGGSITPCPNNTQSKEYSFEAGFCKSNAGYYANGLDCPIGGGICPFDIELFTSELIIPCPNNSRSVTLNSFEFEQCVCEAGWALIPDYQQSLVPLSQTISVKPSQVAICQPCPQNFFCSGFSSTISSCPSNMISPVSSTNITDCSCRNGTFAPEQSLLQARLGTGCLKCPFDFYCTGDGYLNGCPTGKQTYFTSASSIETCRLFESGLTDNGSDCDSDTYCSWYSGQQQCQQNASSLPASSSLHDCTCNDGFTQNVDDAYPSFVRQYHIRYETTQDLYWSPSDFYIYLVTVETPSCVTEIDLRTNQTRVFWGNCILSECTNLCQIMWVSISPSDSKKASSMWIADDLTVVRTSLEDNSNYSVKFVNSSNVEVECIRYGRLHWTTKNNGWMICHVSFSPPTVQILTIYNVTTSVNTTKVYVIKSQDILTLPQLGECALQQGKIYCLGRYATALHLHELGTFPSTSTFVTNKVFDMQSGLVSFYNQALAWKYGNLTNTDVFQALNMVNISQNAQFHAFSADTQWQATTENGILTVSPTGPSFVCTTCPAHSICNTRLVPQLCNEFEIPSEDKNTCLCDQPGTFIAYDGKCAICPANRYCTGNNNSYTCPNVTVSPPGSSQLAECRYPKGQYWNGSVLVHCEAGYFCDGDSYKHPCPANSTSPNSSSSVKNCSCLDGLFLEINQVAVLSECLACPLGSFCVGGYRMNCKDFETTANIGSTSQNDCICVGGYTYDQDFGTCQICQPGIVCPFGHAPIACPEKHITYLGATEISNCTLESGFCIQNNTTIQCPTGYYCPFQENRTDCLECPGLHTSLQGTSIRPFCFCPAGTWDQRLTIFRNSYFRTDIKLTTPYVVQNVTYIYEITPSYILWSDGTQCIFKFYNDISQSGVYYGDCRPSRDKNPLNMSQITTTDFFISNIEFFITNQTSSFVKTRIKWVELEGCAPCPVGNYCPLIGETSFIQQCPSNSISDANATSISDCICIPGYYEINDENISSKNCTKCPRNFFCTGGRNITRCPYNITTNVSTYSREFSTNITNCLLPKGYHDLNLVLLCPESYYCPGGMQYEPIPCPVNAYSNSGVQQLLDCICIPGFYSNFSLVPSFQQSVFTCEICPEDNYCVNGNIIPCPSLASSGFASQDISECICRKGRYLANVSCVMCGEFHFCDGNKRTACPLNSYTLNLEASNISQCICNPGYYKGVLLSECKPCEVGFYCPGNNIRVPCTPPFQNSPALAQSEDRCTCLPGYFFNNLMFPGYNNNSLQSQNKTNNNTKNCTLCPENNYCPGNNALYPCPYQYDITKTKQATSMMGSSSIESCQCPLGTFLFLKTVYLDGQNWTESCRKCGIGFFCSGSTIRESCTPNSTTLTEYAESANDCLCLRNFEKVGLGCQPCPYASDTQGQIGSVCSCILGFYKDNGTCVQCQPGFYCANETRYQCPENKTSYPGASYVSECSCSTNYEKSDKYLNTTSGKCENCLADAYCLDDTLFFCPFLSKHIRKNNPGISGCVCNDGYSIEQYVSNGTFYCNECGIGFICYNGTKEPCYENQITESPTSLFCKCVPGYYNTSLYSNATLENVCMECPSGSFCEDGQYISNCENTHVSIMPRDTRLTCVCDDGYYGVYPLCILCESGYFCSLGNLTQCHPNSWSMNGSSTRESCICDTFFHEVGDSENVSCQVDEDIPTCLQLSQEGPINFDLLSFDFNILNTAFGNNLNTDIQQGFVYPSGDASSVIVVLSKQLYYFVVQDNSINSIVVKSINNVFVFSGHQHKDIFFTDFSNTYSIVHAANISGNYLMKVYHNQNKISTIATLPEDVEIYSLSVSKHVQENTEKTMFISYSSKNTTANTTYVIQEIGIASPVLLNTYTVEIEYENIVTSLAVDADYKQTVFLFHNSIHVLDLESGQSYGCSLPFFGNASKILAIYPFTYIQFDTLIAVINHTNCQYLFKIVTSQIDNINQNLYGIHYMVLDNQWRQFYSVYSLAPECSSCLNAFNNNDTICIHCNIADNNLSSILPKLSLTCANPNITSKTEKNFTFNAYGNNIIGNDNNSDYNSDDNWQILSLRSRRMLDFNAVYTIENYTVLANTEFSSDTSITEQWFIDNFFKGTETTKQVQYNFYTRKCFRLYLENVKTISRETIKGVTYLVLEAKENMSQTFHFSYGVIKKTNADLQPIFEHSWKGTTPNGIPISFHDTTFSQGSLAGSNKYDLANLPATPFKCVYETRTTSTTQTGQLCDKNKNKKVDIMTHEKYGPTTSEKVYLKFLYSLFYFGDNSPRCKLSDMYPGSYPQPDQSEFNIQIPAEPQPSTSTTTTATPETTTTTTAPESTTTTTTPEATTTTTTPEPTTTTTTPEPTTTTTTPEPTTTTTTPEPTTTPQPINWDEIDKILKPQRTQQPHDEENSRTILFIVWITLIALMILSIIVGLIFLCRQKKQRKTKNVHVKSKSKSKHSKLRSRKK